MSSAWRSPASDDGDVATALAWSSDRAIDPAVIDDATAWLEAQLAPADPSMLPPPSPNDASANRIAPGPMARPGSSRSGRALPTAVLILLFNVSLSLDELLVARVFAVGFILLIPGALLISTSRFRPSELAVRLALAVSASALYLMLIAVAADLLLPGLGITEPLGRRPLLLLVNASLAVLLLLGARHREPLVVLFGSRPPTLRHIAIVGALAALPALSAAGAQAVDQGRGPTLAIGALVVCGVLLVGMLFATERVPEWFVRAGIFAVAVAMVYSFTFSGDLLYGWDIQQEFQAFSATMHSKVWLAEVDQDPYRAMLSITALPTVLAQLTGMSGVSLFRGVFPLLFAFFPVLVYVVAGRWLPRAAGFAAAAFVIVQLAFAQQIPAITRQEIALVFFGVLVAIVFDDALPVSYRRTVAVIAGATLAFTHYSTAYVTSLAMLGAWVIGSVVRLWGRRSRDAQRILVLPVVIGILGFTVFWNFGATRSSENVLRFTEQMAERGPEFLPSGDGTSMVSRWLTGNAPQRITGEEYGRRVALIYETNAPWLNGYAAELVDGYPVSDARSPQLAGVLPAARGPHAALLVVASQFFVAATSLGILVFAWQRRRERSSAHELAILGVALLGFVAAMRVSGVAAEAYNQERAQIHAAAVLSIGFAGAVAWFFSRWPRVSRVGVSGALIVIFLASTGLAARVGGGSPPANLADAGDARERFSVSDEEVATAHWLSAHRFPDSIVYADRYGKLRIWAAAVPIGGPSLQGALTPATLDRNAYVYATEANVVGGRARGAIGADYTVYEFPSAFLEANKATIYSTGSTAVFR